MLLSRQSDKGGMKESVASANEAKAPLIVVVVDDSEVDQYLVARMLKKLPDWNAEVHRFSDASDALEALATLTPDVILTDYHMGNWTGLEFFRELRSQGKTAPLILLTGAADVELAAECIHSGVADFFAKDGLNVKSLNRSVTNAVQKDRLQKEVIETRDELAATVDELRDRNREIESFYHSVSHELKTPLTGAREFVSLVLDGLAGEITDKQRSFLETAHKNHDRIVVCINDMLDATRLDTGKVSCHPAPHSVEELFGELGRIWTSKANEGDIDLQLKSADGLPQINVDPTRFDQILNNLISNALKFTDAGGEVRVDCEAIKDNSDFVEIRVSDSGRGIAPEKLDRVFDRLFQAKDEDACVQGGLGLGLYITRELVRLHGGEVEVESEEGQGATFSLTLPTC